MLFGSNWEPTKQRDQRSYQCWLIVILGVMVVEAVEAFVEVVGSHPVPHVVLTAVGMVEILVGLVYPIVGAVELFVEMS